MNGFFCFYPKMSAEAMGIDPGLLFPCFSLAEERFFTVCELEGFVLDFSAAVALFAWRNLVRNILANLSCVVASHTIQNKAKTARISNTINYTNAIAQHWKNRTVLSDPCTQFTGLNTCFKILPFYISQLPRYIFFHGNLFRYYAGLTD